MPTRIEWCEETWNPVTGCDPVSAGCEHCYAKRMSTRLRGRYGYPQDDPFRVTLHPDRLDQPFWWRKPRMIFVCSMGDLFHDDVSGSYIYKVWHTMMSTPQHIFIILTKRLRRMVHFLNGDSDFVPHIWLGVSVEDQKTADERIPILLQVPAAVRIVSIEPMLGAVNLYSQQDWLPTLIPNTKTKLFSYRNNLIPTIGWVICGGETGPRARPMNPEWPQAVKDQCVAADVPFFFKRWGEWWQPPSGKTEALADFKNAFYDHETGTFRVTKKKAGRLLDGREWNQVPETG